MLVPIAEAYKPEMILVSAGFDTHFNDPLGGMTVSPAGFAQLAGVVLDLSQRYAGGRLVLTLEGGYHLGGLADSVRAVIKQLCGARSPEVPEQNADRLTEQVIGEVKKIHRDFWPLD